MNITEIKRDMVADGSHWWDTDTMAFFGTKVSSRVYNGPGGVYFVTEDSAPFHRGPRGYTIREYLPDSLSIRTEGDIVQYGDVEWAIESAKTLAKGS